MDSPTPHPDPGAGRRRVWLGPILLVGLAARVGVAAWAGLNAPPQPGSDQAEYDAYAWNLARGNGYRKMSPDVADQDHLTAYRPPLPSLVMAGVYAAAGHNYAARLLHCLLSTLSVWLTYRVGRRAFGDRVGLLAAAGYAVYPPALLQAGDLLSEPTGVLLFLAFLDRALQKWWARKARRWVPDGARVLDIGCHQGEFLLGLKDRIGPSVGLDLLASPRQEGNVRLTAEPFRQPLPYPDGSFDAVVMLATLEHIRDKRLLAEECARLLAPGGRLIVTVPAKVVDRIVDVLVRFRLADGMSLDEHHGYDPTDTPKVFAQFGFDLEHHARFQLRCNHLFVLRRVPDSFPTGT